MIEVRNVRKTFGFAKKDALRGVSFRIKDHSTFAVLGVDGSGKTTLLNVLAGCLPPTSGSVMLDGTELYSRGKEKLFPIGYMPSRLYMYHEMTAGEYIGYMLGLKGRPKGDPDEVLKICELEDKKRELISSLSVFDTAKLKLAQALAGDVSLLLLDEPTAGLKKDEAAAMRRLIRSARGDRTMILATKLLREATDLCEDIMIINRGAATLDTSMNNISKESDITEIRLRIAADEENAEEFISAISEAAEPERLPSAELGAVDLRITCPQDTNIRALIWQEAVKRNIPILEMTRKNITLEEIFLQMTGEK